MNLRIIFTSLLLLAGTAAQGAMSGVSTFEDVRLSPESHWGGAYTSETECIGFSSGDAWFSHTVSYGYGMSWWNGFVYSNETDMTTNGLENQYSAYIAGCQNNTSGNQYSIYYASSQDVISMSEATTVSGMWLTNTSYAYLTMAQGDPYGYSKKFGGSDGNDQDWFKLTATGITADGNYVEKPVEFYLADFRSDDNSEDYIIDTWTWLDLSSLGDIIGLEFSFDSSDTSYGLVNTPTYFAFDNFNGSPFDAPAVPEPATMALLASGAVMISRRMKK